MSRRKKVLMVCFEDHNIQDDWEVDSAALYDYHEGKNINTKSREVLEKHGITSYRHLARTITKEDFDNFDWILGMDYYNIQHLGQIQPQGSSATIELLGQYDLEGDKIIEDPYFDTDSSRFEKCYQQCLRFIPLFFKAHH
ncbi:low molecular weight phosphotyrosine protein phosphatase-like isoform X2 [Copidosoma floridanum]|uniref:low molecular weight phosphotyrosine protein phosphatase-like isoform X2 n=1 Tax=Copidosoma floridanum TaxID=29053 RepID=UPI0006C9BA28|nr:low molecular weight phosphotyrosine protein phosphatase-like isoform X2 [Copidosoma floridanum]